MADGDWLQRAVTMEGMAWEWVVPVVGTLTTGAVGIFSTINASRSGKRQERALERQSDIQRHNTVKDKTRDERKALYVRFLDVTARASDAALRMVRSSDSGSRSKAQEEADLYLHEAEIVGYEMSLAASEDVAMRCVVFESVLLRFRIALDSIKSKAKVERGDLEALIEVTNDLTSSRIRLVKAMRADLQFDQEPEL
ncbi:MULTISPECIES: hypothetical protein [unclassified Micromonospora]|uniref:hypothetical protein n=1 Tax=unclassified Micromonospora TaxID=2617518 RepID=UPI003630477F